MVTVFTSMVAVMLVGILGLIALGLTVAMFWSRNLMLGFPATLFWLIFGGACMFRSTATWDIYYFTGIASLLGMSFLTMFGAYGLRELKDTDTDEDEFIDEKGGKEQYYGESKREASNGEDLPPDRDIDAPSKPSWRTRLLRKRAAGRKTGDTRKRTSWGEFK